MRVPLACTLTPGDARTRIDEWRRALGEAVTVVDRRSATHLVLALAGGPAPLHDLVSLAQAEVGCCPFFAFAFRLSGSGGQLIVDVPSDAVAVLDDFTALASSVVASPAASHSGGEAPA